MNAPFSWWWPALAAVFLVIAILASSNYSTAVPATAAAVILAAIAVIDAVRRTGVAPTGPLMSRPVTPSGVRNWLAAGKLGREDLVVLLDRLERRASRPDLPVRTPLEMGSILSLPPAEFLRYLSQRLDTLEGTA